VSNGLDILGSSLSDVVPDEVDGFAVKVGIGPFPPDRSVSDRSAVYAELTPRSSRAHALMRSKSRERVLGMVEVTPEAAAEMRADPGGLTAERASVVALAQAVRLIRR
jgi:hypothetical protein